jgi:hypothetical protein
MAVPFTVERAVPYVFCADAGAISTWCQQVLGFVERGRWSDDDGAVSNVELTLGAAEVWLDGPVPDWPSGSRVLDLGSGSGSTIWTQSTPTFANSVLLSSHPSTAASGPATSPSWTRKDTNGASSNAPDRAATTVTSGGT